MGKSTAAGILSALGCAVVDTDQIARDIVAPGEPALAEVRRRFGDEVILADGTLDRNRLGQRVFADAAARKELEVILHPRIREEWLRRLKTWEAQGERVGVVVIPLLYETGAEREFGAVACVACASGSQIERLRQRGWGDTEIRRRVDAQLPVEEKARRADYLIWTEPPPAEHEAQWRRVLVPWAPWNRDDRADQGHGTASATTR